MEIQLFVIASAPFRRGFILQAALPAAQPANAPRGNTGAPLEAPAIAMTDRPVVLEGPAVVMKKEPGEPGVRPLYLRPGWHANALERCNNK
jgi:hypothetical protein